MRFFLFFILLISSTSLLARANSAFPAEVDSLVQLARATWKGENPKPLIASGYYEKARRLIQTLPAESLDNHALYDFYQEALNLIDQNAPLVRNRIERQAFLRAEFPFLENALEVCRQLYAQSGDFHYFEKAFEIVEKSKSLTNHFQSADLKSTFQLEEVPAAILTKKAQLNSHILSLEDSLHNHTNSTVRKKLQTLKDDLSNLNKELATSYPNYYKFSEWNEPESPENLLKELNNDEAVLEYFFGKESVFLIVIAASRQSILKISSLEDANELISTFWQTIREPALYKKMVPASHEVYQIFFAPASEFLKNAEKITIIPDGLLGSVPMEASLKSLPKSLNYDFSKLDYLIHHFQFAYHNSASQMIRQRSNFVSAKSPNIAAFAPQFGHDFHQNFQKYPNYLADNHYVKETQDSLVFLTKNLDWLAAEFDATIYKKENATITNFKQHLDADILHFGTHVIFDTRHPMQSKILLAKEPTPKGNLTGGLLTLEAIQSLQLKGQLAVLAGCESGRGKFRHASGTNSIAYGFDVAGVPATLYSLWKVNEKESAALMQLFYQNLQQNLPKDEALHRAKIDYLERAKDFKAAPTYWAAFVLNGDVSAFSFSSGFPWWSWVLIAVLLVSFYFLNAETRRRRAR